MGVVVGFVQSLFERSSHSQDLVFRVLPSFDSQQLLGIGSQDVDLASFKDLATHSEQANQVERMFQIVPMLSYQIGSNTVVALTSSVHHAFELGFGISAIGLVDPFTQEVVSE